MVNCVCNSGGSLRATPRRTRQARVLLFNMRKPLSRGMTLQTQVLMPESATISGQLLSH